MNSEQPADISFEVTALTDRNNQSESLHQTPDLVGECGRDPDQVAPSRNQRPGQHVVEAFHSRLTEKTDFRKMGQAIGVIRISLVRRHVERGLGVARIDADRRQTIMRRSTSDLGENHDPGRNIHIPLDKAAIRERVLRHVERRIMRPDTCQHPMTRQDQLRKIPLALGAVTYVATEPRETCNQALVQIDKACGFRA